jgi:succinate dehydrogenase/fumarate reductase flavoprotein subunit
MRIRRELTTEVLVIGGGAAGTRAALAAAEEGSKVILANKGPLARSGITLTAGGGLEAPFHPEDNVEQYFQDVVRHGYFLADQNLVWALATDACQRVRDLERYGVRFKKNPDGSFELGKFPGFTYPRNVLFSAGGIGLMNPLKRSCLANANIAVIEDFMVTGLVTSRSGRSVAGAVGLNLKNGELTLIRAGAAVMATGGCQWMWKVNDCPADSTGDGVAMAYRSGARLIDMEMILFYPSVIVWPPAARGAFCHYEFLDKNILDGKILDNGGQSVLPAPTPGRDVAMRMMFEAIEQGRSSNHGGLFWYVGDSQKGPQRVKEFLNTPQYNYIKRQGVDPTREKVEVAPGAHYQLGGIFINEACATTVPGLFATPECAGNHEGANRLSGTALAGTQVFGTRAGLSASRWASSAGGVEPSRDSIAEETERVASHLSGAATRAGAGAQVIEMRNVLRDAAQKYVGVKRSPEGIARFERVIAGLKVELERIQVPDTGIFNQSLVDVLELESMIEIAPLVSGSALMRTESRGHHFRTDFPYPDDSTWLKHTDVLRDGNTPRFGTSPVVVTGMPLPVR